MLQCGSGEQSSFTSYDDLAKWGWRVNSDRAADLGRPHQEAIEYLGATWTPGETFTIGLVHNRRVTVDGITYPPTKGNYMNIYAPDFIISIANVSPRVAAAESVPPVEGPPPKLERQSDLMFLEYQREMNYVNKPMTGLKGILRSGVINDDTRDIVEEALRRALGTSESVPRWPGVDFEAGSDDAAALCATPNGLAGVWLLGTHKGQLGHKTISKVRVYGSWQNLDILFVFKDVDEQGGVAVPPHREKRSAIVSGGNRSQKRVDRRQAVPAPATDAAWSEAVRRGKQFLDLLNCGGGPQSTWTNFAALAQWGYDVTTNQPPPIIEGSDLNALNYLELSPLPQLTAISQFHESDSNNDGRQYRATNSDYTNFYSSEIIIAMNNWGPSSTDFVGPPPRLRQLSDMWFLAYSNLMTAQNKPLDGLKGVWRHHIVNEETRALIFKALKTRDGDQAKWPAVDFQPDSDDFAALLASPNGRGVAWLLINHKQLGRKTFDHVRVWYDGGWMMLFVFKDISDEAGDQTQPSDPDATPAVTQRSVPSAIAARALEPEQYEQLVEKGKKLVSNLQSTEDCFEQSKFTEYGAMAE